MIPRHQPVFKPLGERGGLDDHGAREEEASEAARPAVAIDVGNELDWEKVKKKAVGGV